MDTVPDEEILEIYERIEKEISLAGCETEQQINQRLLQHPKGDTRLLTLIEKDFAKRILEMGHIKNISLHLSTDLISNSSEDY